MSALQEQAAAARELIEALREAGRDDAETVDLSIASETDLKEVVGWALRKIAEAEALEAAAKAAAVAARGRAERFRARGERVRDATRDALEVAGLRKLELGEATISLVPSAVAVHVADEAEVPPQYWREKTERSIDKAAIAKDIKAGNAVPGCHLANARDTLAIRRA